MMKRLKECAALVFCLSMLLFGTACPEAAGIVIENGMAQPMARYTDARSPEYSNGESDLLRFAVYVETD